MFYQAPALCDDQSEPLTYTLTKSDGNGLDQWIIWDKVARSITGLVPVTTDNKKIMFFKMTGTDEDGLSASVIFNISFVSKPYLNRAIDNY
jgi:hypothetical protein